MTDPLVALEVGTHKACAVVGVFQEDGQLEILGVGRCESKGVKKSEIVDPAAATASLQAAITEAEDASGILANSVHLVYGCGGVLAEVQHASCPVVNSERVITEEEIDDVRRNARAIGIPLDREIVHAIPQHYYVDDQPGVTNPLGMVGNRLELDMLILHGVSNRMQNTVRVVSACRASILSAAFGGLCSAVAVLGEEEKQRGALVIDLGGGTTDYVTYADGVPTSAGSIPVGGDHVTNDLSAGLNLSSAQAERLKCGSASCVVDLSDRDASVPVDPDKPDDRTVSSKDLRVITHARMEETLGIVRHHLEKRNLLQRMSAGVFLTGGGSLLADTPALAAQVFKAPCQIAAALHLTGELADQVGPDLAAPVGLLRNAWREQKDKGGRRGFWPFRR